MDTEQLQAIGAIANNLTVVGILLAWLFREIQARKILSDAIMNDWSELKRNRIEMLRDDEK